MDSSFGETLVKICKGIKSLFIWTIIVCLILGVAIGLVIGWLF